MTQADISAPGSSSIPCNLVLIGFMGTGKSTVSEYFHTQYNMDVIEMDQIIAQREGMSITEIFNRYGEEYFRDLETALLIEMQSRKSVILSCGGGVPMRERNVAEMKKIGRVILLTADPQTILERLREDHSRPLLENNKNIDSVCGLMNSRRSKYEAAADIIIHTDGKTVEEISREIMGKVRAANA